MIVYVYTLCVCLFVSLSLSMCDIYYIFTYLSQIIEASRRLQSQWYRPISERPDSSIVVSARLHAYKIVPLQGAAGD